MSFRLLLNLVLIGVLLPALIVPAYMSYEGSISELVNSRVIYRDSQAKTIANAMDRYLLNMQKAVIADSYIPQLHESFSETDSAASQVNELLRMIIAKDEAFVSSAGLISLAGRNRHDTNTRLIGRFEEGTASFVDYSRQRQSTITLQLGAGDYEGIVIASPIKDTNAAVVGFLRLQVALSKLESLMGKSLQGLEDAYRVRLVKTPAGKAVLSSPKVFEQGTPGAAELISLHTLKSLPLIVQVEESYAHFMAPQEAAKRDFYLVVAILISLAVFASVLLSWLVSRPIRQLVSVVDSFQSDDLQQRSTYRGLKEFEHLSEVLNNMADRMEKKLN
jgi:HAMP domain-containing protein